MIDNKPSNSLIYYHYLYKAADGKFYKNSATATKNIKLFIDEYKYAWMKWKNCKLLRVWKINLSSRQFERVRIYSR